MTTIDNLSDDLLVKIAAKIAAQSRKDLFAFRHTNSRHWRVSEDSEVSKAFGDDVLYFLYDPNEWYNNAMVAHSKFAFKLRLWNHGNAMFCILRSTQHMLDANPNIEEMKRLLTTAINATGSLSARYYLLLINALSMPMPENILEDFEDLAWTHRLAEYRSDILGGTSTYRFRCPWWNRPMPIWLTRRRFCNNYHNCAGDGRIGGWYSLLPGPDHDYYLVNACFRCRLDTEIRWFLDRFGIVTEW